MAADNLPSVTLTGGRIFRLPAEPTLEQDLQVMEQLSAAGILTSPDLDPNVPFRSHVEKAVVALINSGKAIPLLATLLVEDGFEDWDETRAVEAIQLFRKEKSPFVKAALLECLAPSVAGFFVNAMRSSKLSLSSFPDLKTTIQNQTEAPSDPTPQATSLPDAVGVDTASGPSPFER